MGYSDPVAVSTGDSRIAQYGKFISQVALGIASNLYHTHPRSQHVTRDLLKTIEGLLEGVQGDVEDPDARYKLRAARQLLSVLEQRNEDLSVAVSEAVSDDELRERLRELGYL